MVLCATVVAGCTSDPPVEGDPSEGTTPTEDAAEAAEAGRLRLRLELEFATFQHRMLEATRARKGDAESAAKSVTAAVEDLVTTVRSVYEASTAARFESTLTSWAERVASHDQAEAEDRSDTRRALLETADDVARLMAAVTDDGMEATGTAALLREPLRATAASVQAHAVGDFEQAYLSHRLAYADMISVGQTFAAGITEQSPDRYGGPRSSGPLELQSALQQFFVEHALLAGVVTRRGAKGAKDFDAAAAALNGNTEDLAAAVDSVYGSDASALAGAWRDRISLLAVYTVAAAEDRGKEQEALREQLLQSDQRIGRTIDEVSESTMTRRDAAAAVGKLTAALLDHVDAHVAGERDEAQAGLARAERAAAGLAAFLADGIVSHRPDDFVSQ